MDSIVSSLTRGRYRGIVAIAAILLLLPMGALAQGSSAPAAGKNVDWPYYGNDQGGMHYQNLDQINPSNISQLQPVWIMHTGVAMNNAASFENQPIIVDGKMFISTGHDQVFALNPTTGAIQWVYNPTDLPPINDLAVCCGQDNRGVAVGGGQVFIARLDAYLVALNEQTGKVDWQTQIAQWTDGYTETMAPTYVDGEVIVGSSGSEYEPRGFDAAYDAKTGKQLWRFYNTAAPGQIGGDTWTGNAWKFGGGTEWDHPEVDTNLGLVYYATSNAAPWLGQVRPGENLFTASIVALNYKTGKLAWYFQEVHHDIWDYDSPEPTMLFDWVSPSGKTVPALGEADKAGWYFILDRATGKPLIPVTETPVSTSPAYQNAWPTQPIPATQSLVPHTILPYDVPKGMTAPPFFTPPGQFPIVVNPGPGGGPQWPPVAYSPRTHDVYLAGIGGYAPSGLYAIQNEPQNTLGEGSASDPNWSRDSYGLVDALNTTTGKIAWQLQLTKKSLSGAAVAGDVVFFGQDTGEFDAVDAATGKLLWSWGNPDHEPNVGGANGSPAVYMVNGREYVVMPFGGNSGLRSAYQTGLPGDAVIAFALPQGTASTAGGGVALDPTTATAKPNIVKADIPDVGAAGRYPGHVVAPTSKPAPGSTVYTVQYRTGLYDPSTIVVAPGQNVSIHLMNTDAYSVAGWAVDLPSFSVAMQSQITAGHDAYLNLGKMPDTPGTYMFYNPHESGKYSGQAGTFIVAEPGQATSPSIPAAQAPTANVGPTKGAHYTGE